MDEADVEQERGDELHKHAEKRPRAGGGGRWRRRYERGPVEGEKRPREGVEGLVARLST